MTKSIYGDKAGNAAHTGFVPGSGVQAHSAGGYFPFVISTEENATTGQGRVYVWDGRSGTEHYSAPYTIGLAVATDNAGKRCQNFARQLVGIPYTYTAPGTLPVDEERSDRQGFIWSH